MSINVQDILSDAKQLANQIKERDLFADTLIQKNELLLEQINNMKEYKEEVAELNKFSQQRPHSALIFGIHQENRLIQQLQQENQELKATLQDYQCVLDMIMSRYRHQMSQLISLSNADKEFHNQRVNNFLIQENSHLQKLVETKSQKIEEMIEVMKQAIRLKDGTDVVTEKLQQLITENKGLREVLHVSQSYENVTKICPVTVDKCTQTEIPTYLKNGPPISNCLNYKEHIVPLTVKRNCLDIKHTEKQFSS